MGQVQHKIAIDEIVSLDVTNCFHVFEIDLNSWTDNPTSAGGCFFLSQSESETSLIEQKRQGLLELKYTIRD